MTSRSDVIPESSGIQASVIPESSGIPCSVIPAKAGIPCSVIPAQAGIPCSVIPAQAGIPCSVIPAQAGIPCSVIPAQAGTQFLDVESARLEILDLGAARPGLPDLLLLHEGLGSISLWRDFPAQLAAATGARVVAYSRAGFGRSSPRERPFTPRFIHEESLEVIPALRTRLGLANPVLVGHSTGASMALVHAGAFDVAGVVAIAPLLTLEDSNLASIRAAKRAYATTDWRAKLARHHLDVDAVFRGWSDTWLDPGFRDWDILADVAKVRAPILAILGCDDEYSTPAQLALLDRAAVCAQRIEHLDVPSCGHAPHRERGDLVLPAIARFATGLGARDGEARLER